MMRAERWRDNWRAVSPPGAVRVTLEGRRASRRALSVLVRDLPAGSPVVVSASAPAAGRRCRAFASRAGLELERQYLALPSAAAPAYLVEDAPAPVGVLVKTVLAAPPGTRLSTPIGAALSVVRALSPWRLMRVLAPGRLVVGRRT